MTNRNDDNRRNNANRNDTNTDDRWSREVYRPDDGGERQGASDSDMPYDRGDWQGQYQSQGGRGQYQGWQGRGGQGDRRWSGERWSGPQGGQGMYGNYSGAGQDWQGRQGQSQSQGGQRQSQGPSGQYQSGQGDSRAYGRPDRGSWDNPADRDWREHQQGRWDDDGSAQVNDRGPLYGAHMGWGRDGRRYDYQTDDQGGSGPHAGKGPKGYQRSDDRIREEVSDALADHGQVDASNVEVAVQNGEVTLAGTVADRGQKRMAEDIVERVRGVSDVHNQLRVQRDYGMGSGAGYAAPKAEPAGTTQTGAQDIQTGTTHKS